MNNFDILVGSRGCGVSSQIAELAVENDGVIVVSTSVAKREITSKVLDVLANSMEEHHVSVFTIHELIAKGGRGTDYTRPIYIDDFDKCFAELLATYHIRNKVVCYGATMEGFECEQL